MQAAQQLSGFNAAMYYAATILQMAGFRSNEGSTSVAIIVAITNMVFTAVAIVVIDKVGRRKMLLFTMLAMIGGLIVLGATFAAQQGFTTQQPTCLGYSSHCARCVLDESCGWSISQNICVPTENNLADIMQTSTGCPSEPRDKAITGVLLAFLIVYVGSYALGLGYIPWLAQAEMFPMSIRGKANGVATAVNWICNLIISTTFLSMTNAMTTAGTFWFYAGLSIVLWMLLIKLMPEVICFKCIYVLFIPLIIKNRHLVKRLKKSMNTFSKSKLYTYSYLIIEIVILFISLYHLIYNTNIFKIVF